MPCGMALMVKWQTISEWQDDDEWWRRGFHVYMIYVYFHVQYLSIVFEIEKGLILNHMDNIYSLLNSLKCMNAYRINLVYLYKYVVKSIVILLPPSSGHV